MSSFFEVCQHASTYFSLIETTLGVTKRDGRLLHLEFQSTPERDLYRFLAYYHENVFLNRMDGDAVLDTEQRRLSMDEWTDQDRVRLAFAYHMRFERRTRDEAFGEIVEIVQSLPERDEQNYLAALILGFSARRLTDEQKRRLMELLRMTDLLREFEEEMKEKWVQEGVLRERRKVAERMLQDGASVAEVVRWTGLSEAEAEEIRKKLN